MPESELFNLVHPYDPANFHFSCSFNGVARSDRLLVIEITLRRGQSDAMKRALYAAITANLKGINELDRYDIFINSHKNDYFDWSMSKGRLVMALVQQPGQDG
ncbi:MAG: tautomerase family protein [Chitinophagaceae bacterium]|nr:tautomerase family protein [Polaromonas sp.]